MRRNVISPTGKVHKLFNKEITDFAKNTLGIVSTICTFRLESAYRWDKRWKKTNKKITCKNCQRVMSWWLTKE